MHYFINIAAALRFSYQTKHLTYSVNCLFTQSSRDLCDSQELKFSLEDIVVTPLPLSLAQSHCH